MGASAFLKSIDFTAFGINVKTIVPTQKLYQSGHAIWWYTLPMPMYTFFDSYDFSGKTIVPFNTHHGLCDGGTYETIKEFEPDATVLEGLPIERDDMDKDQTSVVVKWLEEIVYSQK